MNWTGILSLLPAAAKLVLAIQAVMGVKHSTVAGSIAEWVLRGDRRAGGETLSSPEDQGEDTPARRLVDRIGFTVGTPHADPSQDPPT